MLEVLPPAGPQDDEYLNAAWQDVASSIDPDLLKQMNRQDAPKGAGSEVPYGAEFLDATPYADDNGEKTSYDTLTTITHPSGRETTDYPKDED